MSNTGSESVEFDLSLGHARFCAKGPKDWVEAQVASMLAKPAFALDRHSLKVQQEGSLPLTEDAVEVSPHLLRWLQRHNVTVDELSRVVHVENGRAEVIATRLPGNDKDKVMAAYLLEGLASYAVGEGRRFEDKSARALLTKYGAYDQNNHAAYMKGLQGKLIGNKNEGWALSVPGQSDAARLVKSLASDGVASS